MEQSQPVSDYSRKKTNGGRGHTFFESPPPPGIYFFPLPLEIPEKTKLHKIVLDPLEVRRPKTKTLHILNYFFLVTLWNSTSFLI